MIPEGLIAAAGIRAILLGLGLYNLRRAFGDYRVHRDARGLRGYVAAITMLSGVLALTFSSPAIREWAGVSLDVLFRVATGASVLGFIAGLVFSCLSWRARR